MRERLTAAVLAALLLLTAAGCTSTAGRDDRATSPTTTANAAATPTSGSTSTAAPASAGSSSTTPAGPTTSAGPARARGDQGVGLFFFESPTGNIGCVIDEHDARCDIGAHSFTPIQRPADCDLDWGDAMAVTADRADFVCHGDTVRVDSAVALPYGGSIERNGIFCTSDSTGVTCAERRHGHGFFLSRESFRLF